MYNSCHPLPSSNNQSFKFTPDLNPIDSKNHAPIRATDSQDVQMEEPTLYPFQTNKEFSYVSPFLDNASSTSTSAKTTSALSSQTDEFISKISMDLNSLVQPFTNNANTSKSHQNNDINTLTTTTITSSASFNKDLTFPDSFPDFFPSIYKSVGSSSLSTGLSIDPQSSFLTSTLTPTLLPNTIPNPAPVSIPIGAKVGFTLEEAKEAPVKSLYDICSYRRLPAPVFDSKTTAPIKDVPIPMFGMDVKIRGTTYSTPVVYTSKKHAKAAAALLGLHALGVPVDVDSIYNKKLPEPVVQEHGIGNASTESFFHKLHRLLQRHGLVVPTFTNQCIVTLPPKHESTFTFQGHKFVATHTKKAEARQLCAKKALEYLSTLPDFMHPPTDYPLMLGKYAQSKKWPSPRYFNPSAEGNEMPTDQVHLGVVVNGYTFVRSLGTEYTQAAAKRVVAKEAYEFLLSEEATASTSASTSSSSYPLERPPVSATAPAEGDQTLTNGMDLEELASDIHSSMQASFRGDSQQELRNQGYTCTNGEQPAPTSLSDGVVLTSNSSLNFPTLTPVTPNPWESNTTPSFSTLSSSITTSSSTAPSTSTTPTVNEPFTNPSTEMTKPHISFFEEPLQESKNYVKLLKLVKTYRFSMIEQLIPCPQESTQETLWYSRFAIYSDREAKNRLVISHCQKAIFKEPWHAMECAALNTLFALKEYLANGSMEARELQ